MKSVKPRIRKLRQSMSLTGAIVATAVGVLLPVILATSTGIVALALGRGSEWTIFGSLVISFAASAIGGGVIVTVLLSRRNRIARLQADFVANVTHELRTPLTSIRMYAQTLQNKNIYRDPEIYSRSVDTIVRETEWLEAMIERVLTWRAASKDRDVPVFECRPICDTVSAALTRFERMIPPGEVDLSISLKTQRAIPHDVRGVESLVVNLLVNAYKYSRGVKRIAVALRNWETGVTLQVTDNGIGIPQTDIARIFEPFYRVNSRLSSQASGAGLGLAIVSHVVGLHRGNIEVTSEVGEGTTFSVQLEGGDVKKVTGNG